MASFLSKVFPRKKDRDTSNKRSSVSSLLEGKFEAVSPTISPSAVQFAESAQRPKGRGREKEKEKEKDSAFSLFRPKSRPVSPPPDTRKSVPDVPHLTLNLPLPKEERSRALGVVFEGDPHDTSTLPDNLIGERRLTPLEALLLVKACSQSIVNNGGLETLGVMHPFWYSASPEVQRKLISLFILSLAPNSPITTLSPSPSSATINFNTELEYTRSPHDTAAVLRWALRHLQLEGESFGRAPGQWDWYRTFAEAERTTAYPPTAFTDALVPQITPSHHQLLVATLDIVSSLASHAERNSISGGKLSKFLGLWLLTAKRSEDGEDWGSFYARWERAGRILEHLFLAYIRDEAVRKRMPLRLTELVQGYPYHTRSASDTAPVTAVEDDILPRPRFSTRQYNALYVRVETEILDAKPKHKPHPLRLISDALKSEIVVTNSQYEVIWEAIRTAAVASDEPNPILATVDGYPSLSRIFEDETTRILSFVPAESESSAPTIRLPRVPRGRSTLSGTPTLPQPQASGNGSSKTELNGSAQHTSAITPTTSPVSPVSPKDWMDFSAAGFGESAIGKDFADTLLDKDVEVTDPAVVERKTSKKRKSSSRRSSVDNPSPESTARAADLITPTVKPPKSKSTTVSLVKLDEAFIDFWSDALLDPIASGWPNFVIAQLKSGIVGTEVDGKPVGWLVLEQRFISASPPPPAATAEAAASTSAGPRRASSPRPSVRSDFSGRKSSSTFSAAKKRLTFFASASQTITGATAKSDVKAAAKKKAVKTSRIGEMGEILPEVEEKPEDKVAEKKDESRKDIGPAPVPAPTASDAQTVPPTSAVKESKLVENFTSTESVKLDEPKAVPTSEKEEAQVIPVAAAPASRASSPMSPLTPTAEDFPPVPAVGGLFTPADVTSEAIKFEEVALEDNPVAETDVAIDSAPTTETQPAPELITENSPEPQVAGTSEIAAPAEPVQETLLSVDEAVAAPEPEDVKTIPESSLPNVEDPVQPTQIAAAETTLIEPETEPEAPAAELDVALESTASAETSLPAEQPTPAPAEGSMIETPTVVEEPIVEEPVVLEEPAAVVEIESAAAALTESEVPPIEVAPEGPTVTIVEESSEPAEVSALAVEEPVVTVSADAAASPEPGVEAAVAVEEDVVVEEPIEAHPAEPTPVQEAVFVEEIPPAKPEPEPEAIAAVPATEEAPIVPSKEGPPAEADAAEEPVAPVAEEVVMEEPIVEQDAAPTVVESLADEVPIPPPQSAVDEVAPATPVEAAEDHVEEIVTLVGESHDEAPVPEEPAASETHGVAEEKPVAAEESQ